MDLGGTRWIQADSMGLGGSRQFQADLDGYRRISQDLGGSRFLEGRDKSDIVNVADVAISIKEE